MSEIKQYMSWLENRGKRMSLYVMVIFKYSISNFCIEYEGIWTDTYAKAHRESDFKNIKYDGFENTKNQASSVF